MKHLQVCSSFNLLMLSCPLKRTREKREKEECNELLIEQEEGVRHREGEFRVTVRNRKRRGEEREKE